MNNGTILGRSPNLVVGALTAVFNVLVAFHAIVADASQIAVVNLALGAVVFMVANNNGLQIAAGAAAHARRRSSNDPVPPDA